MGLTQEKVVSYQDFNDSISGMEKLGLYKEAREFLDKCRKEIAPLDPFSFLKEEIYLNEKLGQYQANLALFDTGHKKGFFFMLHEHLPKYGPYLKFREFKRLVKIDQTLRDKKNETAYAIGKIVLPEQFIETDFYPAMFIFHGGGSNIERAEKHWTSKILATEYIRIFIQSAYHYDYNTFGWRNSDSVGLIDFQKIAKSVINEFLIDQDRVYLAGISAGGTQAVFTAFKQPINIQGYIGICTGIPNGLTSEDYQHKTIMAYMIAGDKDRYKPRQDSLAKIYNKNHINHHYSIIEDMGHEYPKDFNKWIDKGLQYFEDHEKK